MAVGKGKVDDLEQAYEILGVDEDAGEKEIQAAYRKGSLKCHPDRNPDDPEAAEKFDQLTRAKDHLLDPAKRGELDRKRKAKKDLEERFAQEDSKRRKLREDLEGREAAAAAGKPRRGTEPSAAELRKRAAQIDYAQRLKAKQAEVAGRQSDVVAEVVQARAAAEEAKLRITWRSGGPPASAETIRKELQDFGVQHIEFSDEGALVQLGSREDALKAILDCRARKHQLTFRAALATTVPKKATTKVGASDVGFGSVPKMQETMGQAKPATTAASISFDDYEAQMLASLQNLANKQQTGKG